ncbi:MAG: D-alanyl-D-alanine carboxypeptidase [Bacteroidaceae bacterium]|nr:D-alanyl-D-alanine carboxypeptidase [Bacteroidaceae bacterium]
MKAYRYALILFVAVALAACKTTTKTATFPATAGAGEGLYSTQPSPLPNRGGAEGEAGSSELGLPEKSLLAQRIDSLLLTADTLLQSTQLGLHIIDLTSGEIVYAKGERQRMRPASTEKMVTAITALDCLGPSYCLTTALLSAATVSGGTLQGDLYVLGAMDPLLSVADVRRLVSQLKAAGVKKVAGRLVADVSMKDEDEYGWGWCWDDENPVLSPLLCGGKPALIDQLRSALRTAGITVSKGTAKGTFPKQYDPADTTSASKRYELAAIRRPLTEVLKPMMKESDNLCAEAIFYQIKRPTPSPSREGGERLALKNPTGKHWGRKRSAAIINELIERTANDQCSMFNVQCSMATGLVADGSGLSLYNYQTPETFTRLLTYAAARQDSIYLPLLEALPIAGVDGTLEKRMKDTPAAANVRAKTGSVSAVSTLVGYTTQRSTGHVFAFAILNNGLPRMAEGRTLQDKICVLLSE